jgi:hypothetical protein
MNTFNAIPRVIRLRDAPHYLGMDRNRFNRFVRPCVTEIRYGKQSLAFDRLELDAWFEAYKLANGQPAHQSLLPHPTYRQRAQRRPGPAAAPPAADGARAKKRFEAAVTKALAKKRK